MNVLGTKTNLEEVGLGSGSARQCPTRSSRTRGLSLLEIVISIAILGAVIGPMLQSSFASSQLSAQSAETQQALRVLESARSTLLGASTADVVDAAGALAPGVNMNLPGALQDQVVTYQFPDWSAPAPLPSLLALRIQIDWTGSRGDARSLAIVDAVKR